MVSRLTTITIPDSLPHVVGYYQAELGGSEVSDITHRADSYRLKINKSAALELLQQNLDEKALYQQAAVKKASAGEQRLTIPNDEPFFPLINLFSPIAEEIVNVPGEYNITVDSGKLKSLLDADEHRTRQFATMIYNNRGDISIAEVSSWREWGIFPRNSVLSALDPRAFLNYIRSGKWEKPILDNDAFWRLHIEMQSLVPLIYMGMVALVAAGIFTTAGYIIKVASKIVDPQKRFGSYIEQIDNINEIGFSPQKSDNKTVPQVVTSPAVAAAAPIPTVTPKKIEEPVKNQGPIVPLTGTHVRIGGRVPAPAP